MEDTAALVQGMQTSVEEVALGEYGPVELDWDTLLTYSGRGLCWEVGCWHQTIDRYGNQLGSWGETMEGWKLGKFSFMDYEHGGYVNIEKKCVNIQCIQCSMHIAHCTSKRESYFPVLNPKF